MVAAFNSYIQTIAVYLIIYAFIEMLLPKSNLKKYVDLCLGLLMLVVMVSPLNTLIKNNTLSFDFTSQADAQTISTDTAYETFKNNMVMDSYKASLKTQIENIVLKQANILIISTDVQVNGDDADANYGAVENISLTVAPAPAISGENSAVSDADIKNIKNVISDFYNLNLDNINIKVETGD